MPIDGKIKDIHMKIQANMLVEEVSKEEEGMVEDVATLSVITMEKEGTSQETIRTL